MFWTILLCAVAAGLVVVFLWSLRGSLLLPVRCGRNTRLELRLRISCLLYTSPSPRDRG